MYIVFEGIVGVGKSTQAKKLAEYFRSKNASVTLTREPGGTHIAEAIRTLVQATKFDETMDPMCEVYLYAAARAQSLRKAAKRKIRISDRSFITSLVYQGVMGGLGAGTVLDINKHALGNMLPDKIIFLDLDVQTALARTHDKAGDKWESKGPAFFNSARNAYLQVSKMRMFANKWFTVSAKGSVEDVFSKVLKVL